MPIVLPSTARPTLTEPTYVKPPVWKSVLAWVGVAVGGLSLMGAVAAVGDGALSVVAMSLFGVALALLGGWWVFCEHKDRTHAEEDFQLDRQSALAAQSMSGYVSPDALAPLTWHTPLTPVNRRWPVVGSTAAALFLGSIALMPATEPAPTPVSTPVAATSTVTSTARVTASTTVTPTPTSTTESPAPAATAAVEPVAVEPAPATPAPAPQPTYAPEPTYAPPPAPVHQSAYYPNCSAVRAAGAAPLYRGQPGYASKLDRDNDGVACE